MFEFKVPPFISRPFDVAIGSDVNIIEHLTTKIKQLNELLETSKKNEQVLFEEHMNEDGSSSILSILVVGLEPDEISVTTQGNRLIVQKIKHDSSEKNKLCNFVYQEFNIKPNQIVESANLKNGVLTITLRYVKDDVNSIPITVS